MSEDLECHFGKFKGKKVSKIDSGYLGWVVNKFDPVPLPKYRVHEDGTPMTVEEVKVVENLNKRFQDAAKDELLNREQT